MPGCGKQLTDPAWSGVNGELAHIYGARPGSSRFAADVPLTGPENLIILCPNHHREIDVLAPQEWPAARLLQIKREHEARWVEPRWATPTMLDAYVAMLLAHRAELGD